jgi:ubiquitin carboxyl-terminal hydrolase 5/13
MINNSNTGATVDLSSIKWDWSKINVPSKDSKVHKEECVLSFDTPRSEGGLNVCLKTWLAFSPKFTKLYFEKTGNNIFLNIKHIKKQQSASDQQCGNVVLEKPTKLAIGVEGGFSAYKDSDPNANVEYEELLSLVCLAPINQVIPLPNESLPERIKMAVEAIMKADSVERKEDLASWEAAPAKPSAYCKNLVQVGNVKIPPHGWKCSKCDKTDNLWLCLSCGEISCGRRFWDGTGGNNHGVEHYQATGHPLVVKLGTIESGGEKADVYSYPEDDMVIDEHLVKHLEYFGIDITELKKTEKTMAELELDQNLSFDFSRIQESDKILQPVFGPGFTGLRNLGNSCYLASVMQCLFAIDEIQLRFFDPEMSLYAKANTPIDSIELQTRKLAYGLLTGFYSQPIESAVDHTLYQEGIAPKSFKSTVGRNHPEFSTMRQQDAMEFFQYLMELYERNQQTNPDVESLSDPSNLFRFRVEDRTMCSESGQVKYMYRNENILSVSVPLESAINRKEYEEYMKAKKEKEQQEKNNRSDTNAVTNINSKPSSDPSMQKETPVRPRIPMKTCLDSFSHPESIPDFYSSALKKRTVAIQTSKLATFPEYLIVQVRRFILDGWVPKKLDVFIEDPQEIDISHLRAHGLQPNETLLPDEPEEINPSSNTGAQIPHFDPQIVNSLVEMGFIELHAQKAAINTNNQGVDQAMNWLFEHSNDPDIDLPLQTVSTGPSNSSSNISEDAIESITAMGIERDYAILALKNTNQNVERAVDWVFSHMDEIPELLAADKQSGNAAQQTKVARKEHALQDGGGKYELFAFVSHIGTSTNCGHYVAHIKKKLGQEKQWILFNDAKVAKSEEPPFDMGYLYFYKRKNE